MRIFEQSIARLIRIALPGVIVILGLRVSPGLVAAISSHGDVDLAVSAIWPMSGPLQAVRDWLPGLHAACGPTRPAASTLRSCQESAT